MRRLLPVPPKLVALIQAESVMVSVKSSEAASGTERKLGEAKDRQLPTMPVALDEPLSWPLLALAVASLTLPLKWYTALYLSAVRKVLLALCESAALELPQYMRM